MPYLSQRSGTFYLRLAVPRNLQPLLGQAEIFQNLGTSDRDRARILALSLSADLLIKFMRWKGQMKNKTILDEDFLAVGPIGEDGIPRPGKAPKKAAKHRNSRFELDVMPNGSPYIKSSDPANPQDFINAKEAKADLFDYIEVFYNRTRRHSHLGGISPLQYEQLASKRA